MAKITLSKTAAQIDLLVPTIVCLVINLAVILLVIGLRSFLPPQIPLLYGQPRGEDQLARQTFLIVPPLLVAGFTITNTILATLSKDHFLQRVLFGFTVLATLLSTVTIVRIMLLVGNF